MTKIPQYVLNLAGEYRVCSELIKRGVFATLTYGNHKACDVYAIRDRQKCAEKVEVKTSQICRFVTKISQRGLDKKTADGPDFWVLFQVRPNQQGTFEECFFVLSHEEMCKVQAARNRAYAEGYRRRHRGRSPDPSKGTDNVRCEDVKQYEDKWSTIVDLVSARPSPKRRAE